MAKKELTREDIVKKQYSALAKLNQRLKNISGGYYIGYDGCVYMQSIVGFVEKFIHLKNPEDIDIFKGYLIFPNKFFEFTKRAKKTKLTIEELDDKIIFGQNDDDELKIELRRVSNEVIDTEYIDKKVKPTMYKRFFNIKSEDYTLYEGCDDFMKLDDKLVEDIVCSKLATLIYKNGTLSLTKQLVLDIKKNESLSIAKVSYQMLEEKTQIKRVMYLLKNECDLYDAYTLFNTLQV